MFSPRSIVHLCYSVCTVTIWRWACRRDTDWISDLLITYTTVPVTTGDYSFVANLHTLLITTTPAKNFQACFLFTSRSLATAYSRGGSSASRISVLLSETPVQGSCQFLQMTIANSGTPKLGRNSPFSLT
jgi:hypothetical protein